MLFKYRFKGKVNSQFVLRGFLFKVGSNIDFCVTEKELEFVKQYCTNYEIIDREPKKVVEIPETLLNDEKGVNNGLQKRNNQGKCKKNI